MHIISLCDVDVDDPPLETTHEPTFVQIAFYTFKKKKNSSVL